MINKIETTLWLEEKQYQVNWELKQVNVLVGENGSGKSRLLELISKYDEATIEYFPDNFANPDIIMFNDYLPISLLNWYEQLSNKKLIETFSFDEYRLLSKGETYLLNLLANIYYCYPNSTVLIDDIEQNLYIGTQRKLLPFLIEQRPDLQFIVTTHSPTIYGDGFMDCRVKITDILTEIQ